MYNKLFQTLILTSLLLFLIVTTYPTTSTVAKDQTLANQTIVIDPGHGGLDNGASSGKYKEAALNLKISLALKEELERRGATVFLTRENEQDLTQRNHHYSKQDDMYLRVRKIDSYEADLFVSIHLNASSNSNTCGSQVFYYGKSEAAKELATDIHTSMLSVTGSHKKIESANFYVLRCTKTKGVLIECGFITNPNERGQLASSKYHKKLSSAIADGIEKNIQKIQTPST